jgi:hypothetical protein
MSRHDVLRFHCMPKCNIDCTVLMLSLEVRNNFWYKNIDFLLMGKIPCIQPSCGKDCLFKMSAKLLHEKCNAKQDGSAQRYILYFVVIYHKKISQLLHTNVGVRSF